MVSRILEKEVDEKEFQFSIDVVGKPKQFILKTYRIEIVKVEVILFRESLLKSNQNIYIFDGLHYNGTESYS